MEAKILKENPEIKMIQKIMLIASFYYRQLSFSIFEVTYSS
jgi:hypothetical protein